MAIRMTIGREERAEMMRSMPIPKLVCTMAFPTVISMLITTIYNLVDTFFVNYLGISAVAAVGVNSSLDQLIMMAGSLYAVGAASFIARLLGMGRRDHADSVLSTAFFTAFCTGIFIAAVGFTFMEPMVRLFGATDSCVDYSIQYASYILYAAPFMASNFVMNQALRAEGSPLRSMLGMAFGGVLNCALDPIFIFVLDLGVAGASMATAISKCVSFCILISPYIRKKTILRLSVAKIKYERETVVEVVSVGSSSLFRSGFAIIGNMILNRHAGMFSDACLAAVSAVTRVLNVPFFSILGFSQGFQPVAGFNWGAKIYSRTRASYKFAAKVCVGASTLCGALLFIFADPVISAFNSEQSAEMLKLGMVCLRSQCVALPFHAWCGVINMLCAGIGRAKYALTIATGRQGYCFIPLVYILPPIVGVWGIVTAQAIADMLMIFVTIPILISVLREMNRRERELQTPPAPPAASQR